MKETSKDTGLPDKVSAFEKAGWEEELTKITNKFVAYPDSEDTLILVETIKEIKSFIRQTLEDEMIKYQKELLKDYKKDVDEARKSGYKGGLAEGIERGENSMQPIQKSMQDEENPDIQAMLDEQYKEQYKGKSWRLGYMAGIKEARKEILDKIKDLKEKGYEATNILEIINNELMFGDL